MTSYRIYVLNRQERIAQSLVREHLNDDDALALAETARADYHAVEVWEGSRLVGRLGGEFSLQV